MTRTSTTNDTNFKFNLPRSLLDRFRVQVERLNTDPAQNYSFSMTWLMRALLEQWTLDMEEADQTPKGDDR